MIVPGKLYPAILPNLGFWLDTMEYIDQSINNSLVSD